MLKKLFKQPFFTIGSFVLLFFAVVGIAGYSLCSDTSVNSNSIMPEWASLQPGSQVHFLQMKRKIGRSWNFWVWGDEHTPEIFSVSQISDVKVLPNQNQVQFIHAKTGLPMIINLNELDFDGKVQTKSFDLGSDRFGRDILSRLIIGTRVSLSIGLLSMILSLLIGVVIGLLAGYFGGWIDQLLSWFITVFWSVPTLLIALGLSFVFGKGYLQVLFATGLSSWVDVARIVRGQTMQLRNREFILSSRITGFSSFHIMFKHILPNLTGTLTVLATTNFAAAILLEAGLSFLGLGVAPPIPSWGMMVKENLGYLVVGKPYLAIIPGAAIMILVMSFNLLSMGLKEIQDKMGRQD